MTPPITSNFASGAFPVDLSHVLVDVSEENPADHSDSSSRSSVSCHSFKPYVKPSVASWDKPLTFPDGFIPKPPDGAIEKAKSMPPRIWRPGQPPVPLGFGTGESDLEFVQHSRSSSPRNKRKVTILAESKPEPELSPTSKKRNSDKIAKLAIRLLSDAERELLVAAEATKITNLFLQIIPLVKVEKKSELEALTKVYNNLAQSKDVDYFELFNFKLTLEEFACNNENF